MVMVVEHDVIIGSARVRDPIHHTLRTDRSGKRPAPTRQHWAFVRRLARRLRRRRERLAWARDAAEEMGWA